MDVSKSKLKRTNSIHIIVKMQSNLIFEDGNDDDDENYLSDGVCLDPDPEEKYRNESPLQTHLRILHEVFREMEQEEDSDDSEGSWQDVDSDEEHNHQDRNCKIN